MPSRCLSRLLLGCGVGVVGVVGEPIECWLEAGVLRHAKRSLDFRKGEAKVEEGCFVAAHLGRVGRGVEKGELG